MDMFHFKFINTSIQSIDNLVQKNMNTTITIIKAEGPASLCPDGLAVDERCLHALDVVRSAWGRSCYGRQGERAKNAFGNSLNCVSFQRFLMPRVSCAAFDSVGLPVGNLVGSMFGFSSQLPHHTPSDPRHFPAYPRTRSSTTLPLRTPRCIVIIIIVINTIIVISPSSFSSSPAN